MEYIPLSTTQQEMVYLGVFNKIFHPQSQDTLHFDFHSIIDCSVLPESNLISPNIRLLT